MSDSPHRSDFQPRIEEASLPASQRRLPAEASGEVVTIHDVAREAKVSTGTVSKVLSGKYPYASATRDRVLEAVERLQYEPNRMAVQLSAHTRPYVRRKHQVPIALLQSSDGSRSNRGWNVEAAYVQEMGFRLESFDLTEFASDRQLSRVLHARGFEGCLIGTLHMRERPLELQWDHFSCVGLGSGRHARIFHHIWVDVFQAVTKLWQHAVEQGWRRIGFAVQRHGEDMQDDQYREAAARLCMERVDPTHRIPLYLGPVNGGKAEFEAWVDECKPDVVLAFNVILLHWLREKGVRVPEDVGFGLIEGSTRSLKNHGVTCMNLRREEVLRLALELLDRQIKAGRRGIPQHPIANVLEPLLIKGGTL